MCRLGQMRHFFIRLKVRNASEKLPAGCTMVMSSMRRCRDGAPIGARHRRPSCITVVSAISRGDAAATPYPEASVHGGRAAGRRTPHASIMRLNMPADGIVSLRPGATRVTDDADEGSGARGGDGDGTQNRAP